MSISKEYLSTLRKRDVQKFIAENKRSPTVAELREIINKSIKDYYAVDETGIVAFDLVKPKFRQESSIEIENNNREAIYLDLMTLNQKLDNLLEIEETAYRASTSTFSRVNKTLDEFLERLDNLLLINGQDDLFLQGVEETFAHQLHVDYANTTAAVESFNVQLGKRRLDFVDLSKCKLAVTAIADKGYIAYEANSSIKSIINDDGNIWQGKIKTNYQLGRVSLLLSFTFSESTDISLLKIKCLPIEVNKIMTSSVYYSTNGSSFNIIEPFEQRLTESFSLPINKKGVKKIQVLLSKEAADRFNSSLNEYEFLFLLDKIAFEKSIYEQESKSTLFCGPYDIVDTSGKPVYFTKATLKACTMEPEGTSIAFYISNNGIDYRPIDHHNKTSNYVSFGDNSSGQALSYVYLNQAATSLIESVGSTEEYDVSKEAYLNAFVVPEYTELIPYRNITIKRNIAVKDVEISGIPSGWIWNSERNTYSTIIYISNSEGRQIDFGPKGIMINNNLSTGLTWLKNGYSYIEVNSTNWNSLPNSINNETDLKTLDVLYPYNHRYLIEGYKYIGAFLGEKLYTGVDEYFGKLLNYVSQEEFEIIENNNYNVFTIEEVDDQLYFKVKVDKTSSTWQNEHFAIDFVVQSQSNNQLWIKAILSSNDSTLTPVLESFKVRVI